ncbi:hypothetical protein BaRGS_00026481 [Batillaria attramentaria]|uniref:Uncharacterized protein n=1 Tax=Batillaria attramentaria TaxID=370345 RepID=A0ABD0K570_9CAEN
MWVEVLALQEGSEEQLLADHQYSGINSQSLASKIQCAIESVCDALDSINMPLCSVDFAQVEKHCLCDIAGQRQFMNSTIVT